VTKRAPQERSVLVRDRDFPGFLDMLRYDQCTVVKWSHLDQDRTTARGELYEITLRGDPNRVHEYQFTEARWASFGLTLNTPL
jgi:hypothetical protein